jgi:phosphatidylserine/phosphatidylglycerophosphate/cardiolipin synthase-like enzyme/MFS family permease
MNLLSNKPTRNILTTALGYGLGAIGGLVPLYLIVRLNPFSGLVPEGQLLLRLYVAILEILIGLVASGAVTGAAGGWALARIDPVYPRRRYLWRSGTAFAVAQLLFLVYLLLTAGMALYNNGTTREPWGPIVLFGLYGLVYGLVAGLILGFSTTRFRDAWRVILASTAGFALGGGLLGYLLWLAFLPTSRDVRPFGGLGLVIGVLFLLHAVGGASLGLAFTSVAHRRTILESELKPTPRWLRLTGIAVLVLLILSIITNLSQIGDFLVIRAGSLSEQLKVTTVGVQWQTPFDLENQPAVEPDPGYGYALSAGLEPGSMLAAWSQGNPAEIILTRFQARTITTPVLGDKLNLSQSPKISSTSPSLATDPSDTNHVVWVENDPSGGRVIYSRCSQGSCSEPIALSDPERPACEKVAPAGGARPSIASDSAGNLLVVWEAGGSLVYSNWGAGQSPPNQPSGCLFELPASQVPQGGFQPQLAGGGPDSFVVVYNLPVESGGTHVAAQTFSARLWSRPVDLGAGTYPTVTGGEGGQFHLAWCGAQSQIVVQTLGATAESLAFPPCLARPALVQNTDGTLHVLWGSDRVVNTTGGERSGLYLYESIRLPGGWSEPAIFASPQTVATPITVNQPGVGLYAAWMGTSQAIPVLSFAAQPVYTCSPDSLSPVGRVVLAALAQPEFRPGGEDIPFCQNRFVGYVYMPNPDPAFSSQPASENGGFDVVSLTAGRVEYELLFATMEYAPDEDDLNPGSVLAQEIAQLYQQIKADPARYPKGLTVRILLGNYPEMSNFVWGEQIWDAISDLREAGVEEMVNPEIGWKLEVANFDGTFPHSHTKVVVIDGELLMGAGFNYGYLHYPRQHPSNKGDDLTDLGLIVEGPVAQEAIQAFDDMWEGGNQIHCTDFYPFIPELWTTTCHQKVAHVSHVPEVLRYTPASVQGTNAFSLFRNTNYHAADEAIRQVVASAQDTLDIFEVNFSLKIYCVLDLLNDEICDYEDRLPFLDAITQAVEQNDVKVRVLVEKLNMNGMENKVAGREFLRELERRGLSDNVEIRFFGGRMHAKAVLIDQELVIVGSQNFHYSSWGDGGLAEYSVASEDPVAIANFLDEFNYYWEQGIPFEEYLKE